jgi:hypothetical protein
MDSASLPLARVRNDVNTVILANARIQVDVESFKWILDHLRRARPDDETGRSQTATVMLAYASIHF